jgi:DNA-binding winged helix-turn-helix (wHTH) protein
MSKGISALLDQVARSQAGWDGNFPLSHEDKADKRVYLIWEPEPGLLMLAIWSRPSADSSTLEPRSVKDGNGRKGSKDSGAEQGREFRFPKAAYQSVNIEEDTEADCRQSVKFRTSPMNSNGHAQQPSDRQDLPRLSIDPATREVEVDGQGVELTRKEFELLHFLARNKRHVFTRSQLLDCVWGRDFWGDENTVTVHISRLRRKLLRSANDLDPIQTVWGVGYRFDPSNTRVQLEGAQEDGNGGHGRFPNSWTG